MSRAHETEKNAGLIPCAAVQNICCAIGCIINLQFLNFSTVQHDFPMEFFASHKSFSVLIHSSFTPYICKQKTG